MLSPVSAVRFCANEQPTASVAAQSAAPAKESNTSMLEREGAFAKPKTDAPEQDQVKKKSSVGKKILKTVAGLAAVAAGLVLLQKTNVVKVLSDAAKANAGLMEKAGHYLAVAGEAIAKYTCDPIIKMFK